MYSLCSSMFRYAHWQKNLTAVLQEKCKCAQISSWWVTFGLGIFISVKTKHHNRKVKILHEFSNKQNQLSLWSQFSTWIFAFPLLLESKVKSAFLGYCQYFIMCFFLSVLDQDDLKWFHHSEVSSFFNCCKIELKAFNF